MKTRSQIENEINSYIVTNNNQQITAVQVNQLLNDLNDSTYNKLTDTSIGGLSNFATSSSYSAGNSVIYDGYIWNANVSTIPGPFSAASWTRIQKLKVTGTRAQFLSLAGAAALIPGSMYQIEPDVVDIFIWAIGPSDFSPIAYNLQTGESGLYDINTDTFTEFATGSQGRTGPQGATGSVGATGVQGFTGPQGATGVGLQGATGVQGNTGVQGATGPQGVQGLAGPGGDVTYYGVFYSTSDQTNVNPLLENPVSFEIDGGSNAVSVIAATELNFSYAGTYKVSFSLQFTKSDAGQDTLNVWLKLNGSILDYTNRVYTLEQLNSNQRIQSDYIVTVTAGSSIQICWSSSDVQMKLVTLPTQSSPDRPITTSAYVDIHKIIYSGYEGIPGSPGFFLIAYSNTTQTNPVANTARYMTFSNVIHSQGINLLNNRQIQVDYTGVYNIQFSAQFDKTDAGADDFDIWFRKNNVDIDYSNTTVTIHDANGKTVPSWNYMDLLNGGDYIEIMWSSADTGMRILAQGTQSSPSRPAIPSIILTVQQVQYQNEAGATGIQGTTGPQGLIGVTGSQGSTGPQGFTGPQGSTGVQGNTGPQGNTGTQGFQGETGPQGNRGFQGFTGVQGDRGFQGFQGFTGPQGSTGNQGVTGPQGSTGTQGFQGVTGPQGSTGVGVQGATGVQGNTGPQGFTGPQGPAGSGSTQNLTGVLNVGRTASFISQTLEFLSTTNNAYIGKEPFDSQDLINVDILSFDATSGVGLLNQVSPILNSDPVALAPAVYAYKGTYTGLGNAAVSSGLHGIGVNDSLGNLYTAPITNVNAGNNVDISSLYYLGADSTEPYFKSSIQVSATSDSASVDYGSGPLITMRVTSTDTSYISNAPAGQSEINISPSVIQFINASSYFYIQNDSNSISTRYTPNIFYNTTIQTFTNSLVIGAYAPSSVQNEITIKPTSVELNDVAGSANQVIGVDSTGGTLAWKDLPEGGILVGGNVDAITRIGAVTQDIGNPLTVDALSKASIDGSNNIFIDRESFYLSSDVDNPSTAGRIRVVGQTGPGSTGQYTLILPIVNDTVATRATNEALSNKNISSSTYDNGTLGATTLVSMYNVGVPSGNAAGDMYFRGTASTIKRLGIGATNSVLVVGTDNLPTWKQRNFNKVTDGTAVTATVNNTYTDGILIPANSVSAGDIVELRSRVRKTGTGATLTARFYIGVNNSLTSANLVGLSSAMANVTLTGQMVRTLVVKSATSTEVYPVTQAALNDDALNSATAVTTYNIDWTVDQYFVVSVQQSVGTDTTRSSFVQVKILE